MWGETFVQPRVVGESAGDEAAVPVLSCRVMARSWSMYAPSVRYHRSASALVKSWKVS